MTDADADSKTQRRVMPRLTEPERIPIIGIRESDAILLLLGVVGGLLVASAVGAKRLGLPVVALLVGVIVVAMKLSPGDRSAWEWLRDLTQYALRPGVTEAAASAGADAEATDTIPGSGLRLDTTTQDLTGIKRVWPGEQVLERPDGTLEAWLRLDPGHMEFAMSDDWASVQRAAAAFANDDLEFEVTFHATTRPFPVEEVVAELDDRLQDPDVRTNPALRALLEEYRETLPAEMADQGTQQITYYLGVSIHPADLVRREYEVDGAVARLRGLPVVGLLTSLVAARRLDDDETVVRERLRSRLDERVRTLRADLVDEIPDWSARRLSSVELLSLAAGFWDGDRRALGDADAAVDRVPTQPVIRGASRRADAPTAADTETGVATDD